MKYVIALKRRLWMSWVQQFSRVQILAIIICDGTQFFLSLNLENECCKTVYFKRIIIEKKLTP